MENILKEIDIEKEIINVPELLNEKNLEISKLRQKLDEKEKAIHEILAIRESTNLIYCTGLFVGIIMLAVGFLSNSIVSGIAGFSVSIVSIVGIYEAKRNKW